MFKLKIVGANFIEAAWEIRTQGAKFLYSRQIPQSIKDHALEQNRESMYVVIQVPASEELYTSVRSLAYGGNETANALVDKWEDSWTATLSILSPEALEIVQQVLLPFAYNQITDIKGSYVYCSVGPVEVVALVAALGSLE